VVEREAQRAVLQVPTAELRRVVAAALEQLPVSDLTVEGAPLEEVLAELFARGRAAAATPTPSASSPETPR